MVPFFISSIAAILISTGVYLPSPLDTGGWALRVHSVSMPGPFLVGEEIWSVPVRITLFNLAKQSQQHDPLNVANGNGRLLFDIRRPDGQIGTSIDVHHRQRDPRTQQIELRTGECTSHEFKLAAFGYSIVRPTGRYSVQATLKIDGMAILSPPSSFEVIELSAKAILSSNKVDIEGRETEPPEDERARPVIQQVQIGNRVFLFYSRYNGPAHRGTVRHTIRVTELPGKVEDLKVEGAFGDGNPLTITYRATTYTKFTTKLVINSSDGSPWRAVDEKHRQDKRKREDQPASPDKK